MKRNALIVISLCVCALSLCLCFFLKSNKIENNLTDHYIDEKNINYNPLTQLSLEESWEYLIQPGEYEEIKLINSNLIAVKNESGNYGIINRKKEIVIDFDYVNIWGNENNILVMDQDKKFSILDCEGNLISKERYDRAELFCEDLAAVKQGDKWGFIDSEGNLVIDYQYDNVYDGFHEGFAVVEKENRWRFIDTTGEWVFGTEFENAHTFSEGLAAVMQNGIWGFIDLSGEMVIETQYDKVGDFGEGLAAVCKEIDGVMQWAYIDKSGNICIEFQPYDVAEGQIFIMGEFHDGYAMITDVFYCLIDKNGQCILGKEDYFLTGGFDYSKDLGVIPAYDYADEDMMIKKYGLVDINGNEIVPFIFYNISDVQGDLVSVASEENMITNGVLVLKQNAEIKEIEKSDSDQHVYDQNDAYKLFYGTWEVTSIVSEHVRLGGDEGCEDILGMQITYLPDKYEFGGIVSIENPNYLMSIFPTDSPFLNMQEQVSMKTLMPDSDYFVWVQIVDKPTSSEAVTGKDFGLEPYVGDEFFIKDDNTLYCFNYNCIYELKRVNHMDGYDPQSTLSYHERW